MGRTARVARSHALSLPTWTAGRAPALDECVSGRVPVRLTGGKRAGSTDERRQRTVISDVVISELYPWAPRLNSNCVIIFQIQRQAQLAGLAALLSEGAHMAWLGVACWLK